LLLTELVLCEHTAPAARLSHDQNAKDILTDGLNESEAAKRRMQQQQQQMRISPLSVPLRGVLVLLCRETDGPNHRNAFHAPFYTKNDGFTKTGSGQQT
jgi:hypothetical protein